HIPRRSRRRLSMSRSAFLDLVGEGKLPKPIRVGGMTMWDRRELDSAIEDLKEQEGARRSNPIEKRYGIGGGER
ncbi:MAG: hypothetical protein WCB55_03570, partial [Pseudolabrys sp.]